MQDAQNSVGALAQVQPTMDQSQANLSLGSDPAYSLNSNTSLPASVSNASPLPVATPQQPAPTPAVSPFQEQQNKLDLISSQIQDRLEKGSGSNEIPWFALAGALLSPTRTGSFGESLGNASNVMAQYQAEQKKQELPNLQARMAILQQDLATKKQNKLLELAPQAFTTDKNGNPTLNNDVYNQMMGIDPKMAGDLASGHISLLKALKPEYKEIPEGGTLAQLNNDGTVKIVGTGGKKTTDELKNAHAYLGIQPDANGNYDPADAIKLQNYMQNTKLSPDAKTAFDALGFNLGQKLTPEQSDQLLAEIKRIKEAGSTKLSVNTHTQEDYESKLVGAFVKGLDASKTKADEATKLIDNIHTARRAVESGKINLGPQAQLATVLQQVGTTLGVAGKNTQETLENTRRLLQSQAKANLAYARMEMKGEGSITENERALVERAADGDISMTPAEILVLLNANEKLARMAIQYHNEKASHMPTGGSSTAESVKQDYFVPMPRPYISQKDAQDFMNKQKAGAQ